MSNTIAFSETTIKFLRNLSTINQGLLFTTDSILSSISQTNDILCSVKIEEKIPIEFGVYNLKNFLDTLTLFDAPILECEEEHILIKDHHNKDLSVRYGYCSKTNLHLPPEKKLKLPSKEISFDLSYEDLHMCLRASNKLGLPCLSVVGRDGSLVLEVSDPSQQHSSNSFTKVIGSTKNYFSFNFFTKKLNLFKDDYKVNISAKLITHLKSKNYDCEYWISANTGSSFDG